MFNVTRALPAPASLARHEYNSPEVVSILESMFYGKCYLCERDELFDPEVEHLIPHENDDSKKYDWNNLYYACNRCNSIKGTAYREILDCCDSSIDVFRAIKCLMPSIPDAPIIVEAQICDDETRVVNTAALLNRCYNEDNTGIRGITRKALHERIFDHYALFVSYRRTLIRKDTTVSEKAHAKEKLAVMADVKYPFSVFWRWHILIDSFLGNACKEIIDF
jgi:hypothetical protein